MMDEDLKVKEDVATAIYDVLKKNQDSQAYVAYLFFAMAGRMLAQGLGVKALSEFYIEILESEYAVDTEKEND